MERKIRLDELDEGRYIKQFSDGFLFGTDAVLLADLITLPASDCVGAEFGTGTGIVPILLASGQPFRHITAFEIDPDYAALAADNFETLGLSDRVSAVCADLKDAPGYFDKKIDFVFTNPPYMKADSGHRGDDPKREAARREIHCTVESLCASAGEILKNGGLFFAVYRCDRLADMLGAMRSAGIEPKELTLVDTAGRGYPELMLVRGKKRAAPGMKVRVRRLKAATTRDKFGGLYEDSDT